MVRARVTHAAYDRGTYAAILKAAALAGKPPAALPKTFKTLCQRRARVAQLNNQAPTCPQCRDWCERAER